MINNKIHEFFMSEALKQAKLSFDADEIPIGAVLVYQNKIIASGHNLSIAKHDPSAHAEILTIRNAGQYMKNYRLLNCSLYVTVEPCVMCLGAIFHARVSNLIFGAYDPKTGACESVVNLKENKELNHHCVIHGGVLEKESKTLLQNFFKNKRKKP
ncbi:tRNA adenosine(34) deaminase TadA [Methylophilaceae bacterium]|jgi:tRNA(adenine34) deaminase|nr:tRNA adenosine(34) deaminase TadA [Methylophilaceae bacterium]